MILKSEDYRSLNTFAPALKLETASNPLFEEHFFDSNNHFFNWNTFRLKIFLPQINDIITHIITIKKYDLAIDIIFNEIYIYSNMMAISFKETLESKFDIPILLEKLMDSDYIEKEEWLRLNNLLLILDGIKSEVKNYGGTLDFTIMKYANEFLLSIKKIMLRNKKFIAPIDESFSSHNLNINESYQKNLSLSYMPVRDNNDFDIKSSIAFVGVV